MKKNLLLLFVLMISLFTYSQNITVKDGPYKEYYKNGQLKSEGQYKNRLRVGNWKSFYETGELSSVYSYHEGKRDKVSKSFFKDGSIKSETKKINEVFIRKQFYESGNLFYERALSRGYYKEYFESGILKIESNYKDWELSGLWRQFFESGDIEWEVMYKNGYKDGFYRQYFENGKLSLQDLYKIAQENGELQLKSGKQEMFENIIKQDI